MPRPGAPSGEYGILWRSRAGPARGSRPTSSASILANRTDELLWQALDREGAELRVFFADLPDFFELCRVAPGLNLLHAVPDLDGDALLRRRSLDRGDVLAGGQQPPSGCLDQRLGFSCVLLRVGIQIGHVDLGNVVHRRLRLGVQVLDGRAADSQADCAR